MSSVFAKFRFRPRAPDPFETLLFGARYLLLPQTQLDQPLFPDRSITVFQRRVQVYSSTGFPRGLASDFVACTDSDGHRVLPL